MGCLSRARFSQLAADIPFRSSQTVLSARASGTRASKRVFGLVR